MSLALSLVVLVKRKVTCMEQLALIRDELTSSAFSLPSFSYAFLFKNPSYFQNILIKGWCISQPDFPQSNERIDNRPIGNNNIEMEVAFRWFSIIINSRMNCNPGPTDDVPRWLIIDFDGLLVRLHAPHPRTSNSAELLQINETKR